MYINKVEIEINFPLRHIAAAAHTHSIQFWYFQIIKWEVNYSQNEHTHRLIIIMEVGWSLQSRYIGEYERNTFQLAHIEAQIHLPDAARKNFLSLLPCGIIMRWENSRNNNDAVHNKLALYSVLNLNKRHLDGEFYFDIYLKIVWTSRYIFIVDDWRSKRPIRSRWNSKLSPQVWNFNSIATNTCLFKKNRFPITKIYNSLRFLHRRGLKVGII